MPLRYMVLLLMLATVACACASAQQQPLAYHCAQDGDIDAMRRAVIESAATTFVQNVISGSPGSAWETMTDEGRHTTSRDQFVSNAMLGIIPTQPRNLAVRHTFLIHVVGAVPADARVACGTDVSDPMQLFNMAVVTAPEQSYVLLSADGTNDGLIFTVWLLRSGTGWAVNSFAFNVATVAGRDSIHLWQLARAQHQLGHEFNAALLYFAALATVRRGDDFQMGYAAQIQAEQAQVTRPAEINGNAPFTFDPQGKSFMVRNIGASGAGTRLLLAVTQEVARSRSTKQIDERNRELISFIKKRFPEYAEVFDGIVVQGTERGTGRTVATVDERESRRP